MAQLFPTEAEYAVSIVRLRPHRDKVRGKDLLTD